MSGKRKKKKKAAGAQTEHTSETTNSSHKNLETRKKKQKTFKLRIYKNGTRNADIDENSWSFVLIFKGWLTTGYSVAYCYFFSEKKSAQQSYSA